MYRKKEEEGTEDKSARVDFIILLWTCWILSLTTNVIVSYLVVTFSGEYNLQSWDSLAKGKKQKDKRQKTCTEALKLSLPIKWENNNDWCQVFMERLKRGSSSCKLQEESMQTVPSMCEAVPALLGRQTMCHVQGDCLEQGQVVRMNGTLAWTWIPW